MGTSMPEETRLFLEKLIEDKKFENLSPAFKETMIESLNKRLEAYILTAIFEKLDEKTAAKLETIMESKKNPSSDDMQKFLQENVPGAGEAIAQALIEFRLAYLSE